MAACKYQEVGPVPRHHWQTWLQLLGLFAEMAGFCM